MDSVIDLTKDDLVYSPNQCPKPMSNDGVDDDLCFSTHAAKAGVVALKAGSIPSGTPTSRTWRLPSLEEDHMQEVVDLLLPQPKSKSSLSSPERHKGEAWTKPALSPAVPHSRKSSKSKPNITNMPNLAFKKPRTIRMTSDVETSSSPPCAAMGSITARVKRARQPFRFLELPPEMRNRVYNLLLTTSEPIEMTRARQTTAKREGWLPFLSIFVPIDRTA